MPLHGSVYIHWRRWLSSNLITESVREELVKVHFTMGVTLLEMLPVDAINKINNQSTAVNTLASIFALAPVIKGEHHVHVQLITNSYQ